ncbi:uncharacterized protein LOC133301814 [Gastrolobium bilobum]|uniref:uncharacterized protein LOC133301814 n=1 Tax=Gastrolobium bilobum TaxID=150636 RepID=UPI002AB0F3F9|nr:uncharacterized protein LOC133301814 [Gastrolobium bilobum]
MDKGWKYAVDPRSLLKFVKMEIPLFDGVNPDTWIFRTELFFDLQRVPPELKVQLAGLRMDGLTSSWFQWKYRSGTIKSWTKFTTALRQRFGVLTQKHIRGTLSKVSQKGSLKDYFSEFEMLMNQTQDLSEELLLSFLVSGLTPDLRRALEIHDPKSLQQAMELATVYDSHFSELKVSLTSGTPKVTYRLAQGNMNNSNTGLRSTPVASSNSVATTATTSSVAPKIPFRKLSSEEMNRKRDLGLCFTCDEKWNSKHKCQSKMLLMVGDDHDEDGEEEEDIVWNAQTMATADAALHSLSEGSVTKAFKFLAQIHGKNIPILVDTGSTHNFVKTELAIELGLPMTRIKKMRVFLGNGEFMVCDHKCRDVHLWLQGEEFILDLWVLNLEKLEMILGICWLEQLGRVTHDYKEMAMEFTWRNKAIRLVAQKTNGQQAMLDYLQAECWSLQQEPTSEQVYTELSILKSSVNELIWQILLQHQSVFSIPKELPPFRDTVHAIHLEPGCKPVNVRPYRYGHHQKEEIEQQVSDLLASGFIKPSNSPYSSPILLVRKQDQSWRMCVDYQALNKITIRDRFPMPTIDELMDELGGGGQLCSPNWI